LSAPPRTSIGDWQGEGAVFLAAGDYEAVFLPGLGMLGASLTFRGDELLSLAGVSTYRDGHQTGLPLLAPWANRLATRQFRVAGADVDLRRVRLGTDENRLPIHGTMTAASGWEIVKVEPGLLRARFDYGARDNLLKAFPFPHVLELAIRLSDDGLRVHTMLMATGRRRVPVSFGWHPYFRVPGNRRQWWLELPARRHLELDVRGIPTGRSQRESAERQRLGNRTFDDGYALGRDRQFALESAKRRLEIRFLATYPFGQLYAPPGSSFVAIEPMTAPTNALVTGSCPIVRPGGRFTASFEVTAH
jgi:galactose mutarotase-like enzyme